MTLRQSLVRMKTGFWLNSFLSPVQQLTSYKINHKLTHGHYKTVYKSISSHIRSSELDTMKKSLTTSKSIYIEVIFRKKLSHAKDFCQNRQLEKCPSRQKRPKSGLLSLVSRVSRPYIIKFLMFTTRTR